MVLFLLMIGLLFREVRILSMVALLLSSNLGGRSGEESGEINSFSLNIYLF